MSNLTSTIKSIQDIMRKDFGYIPMRSISTYLEGCFGPTFGTTDKYFDAIKELEKQ